MFAKTDQSARWVCMYGSAFACHLALRLHLIVWCDVQVGVLWRNQGALSKQLLWISQHGIMQYCCSFLVSEFQFLLTGTTGGICIQQSKVKFLDLLKTNNCKSICQGCFLWSRTKVRGSKTIRYRPSLNYKPCWLDIGRLACSMLSATFEKSKLLGSGGSMVARLKLKGIDGRAPPGVEPAA